MEQSGPEADQGVGAMEAGPPAHDHDHGHDHGHGEAHDAHAAGAGLPSDPATKAEALARHRRGRDKVRHIIEAGLAQTIDPELDVRSRKNLYKNACEWVDEGHVALFALSPIHDSADRPDIPAGQSGFFQEGLDYETDGADYNDGDLDDNTGLEITFSTVLGSLSTDGTALTIMDPVRQSEALLVETLIHEVQHSADQHQNRWAVSQPTGGTAPAWAYNAYQSEFRAYWLENPEGAQADRYPSSEEPVTGQLTIGAASPGNAGTPDLGEVTTNLQNARQEAILRHLIEPLRPNHDWFDGGEWTQSYAYVAHYMVTDPEFLAMVNDFDSPVGGNALGSVRIQALSDAIDARSAAAIVDALRELDGADCRFLADEELSAPFWDQCTRDLTGLLSPFVWMIRGAIRGGAAAVGPADSGGTYEVVAGDNLSRIAARVLGDASRWLEIYALNRDLIGDDPDRIEPGQVLSLPMP